MSAYVGIGSRGTPPVILELMTSLGYALADGWYLRSGGADGADHAFVRGHFYAAGYTGLEIFLPWANFNGWSADDADAISRWEPQEEAYAIAAEFHPVWERLTRGVRALHARNVHQILGPDVTRPVPSRFVICWTKGARGGGGTGQAIRIANAHEVPVFDLADAAVHQRLTTWLNGRDRAETA